MAAFSTSVSNQILNITLRNTPVVTPAGGFNASPVYVALFTTPTTAGGGGTEVADVNYLRQAVTFTDPSATPALSHNAADITFPAAAAPYTVTHCAIMTVGPGAGGVMIYQGPVAAPKSVGTGESFRMLATSLVCGLN